MKISKLSIILILATVLLFSLFSCKKSSPTEPQSTPTPSPTATIPDYSLYGFEDGTTMGWGSPSGDIKNIANTTDKAYAGTHSLALRCTLSAANSGDVGTTGIPLFTSVVDKIIIAKLWVPLDFPTSGAGIYIKTGPTSKWQNGWTNFTKGAWNNLICDPTNLVYPVGTATDQNDVRSFGLGIGGYSGSTWKGTLYLDNIELIDAPAATPVTTPAPTLTPEANSGYPSDPLIQYYGRWDMSDPTNYRTDWGPSYIKINFTGNSCMVKLRDSSYNGAYQYSLDGGAFTTFMADVHTTFVLATGIADTAHTLTFVRRLEGQNFGYTNFQGFAAAPGGTFTLTAQSPRPSRKLEFIGDSISAGSGNEGTGGNSPTTENGYMAFGPQTARLCDAEWTVIARGGLGVFHNWNETYPPAEKHALDYYKQTLYGFDSPSWDFSEWQPDAVVIALGTNDTNGQWIMPAGSTVTASFKASYNDLIDYIESVYPSAQVICMEPVPQWCMQYDGAGTSGGTQTYIKDVVEARTMDTRVHYLQINTSYSSPLLGAADYIGDNTHPNVAGHTKIAAHAAPLIKTIMGW
jgi:hypothetical protein